MRHTKQNLVHHATASTLDMICEYTVGWKDREDQRVPFLAVVFINLRSADRARALNK